MRRSARPLGEHPATRLRAVARRAAVATRTAMIVSTTMVVPTTILLGCSAARPATDAVDAPAPRSAGTTRGAEDGVRGLAAMVDGDAIDGEALRVAAFEMAGATALREAVLDARLARRLARDGIRIDPAMVEAERAMLLESLSTDGARAIELLGEIRARQGLGPARFEALLRRNAGLRALVARSVEIDEAGVEAVFDMRHGPRRIARVAVVADLATAERIRADAEGGRPFADLAFERSLDATAARGGLLEPVSRRDPSYPEALRAAIWSTPVGARSQPALDGARILVVEVLEERPADGVVLADDRVACERLLRLSRERLLMDALARELASLDGVTVFDRALDGAARGG